jgi:tetratricopeptide (TPR) repeat protein
VDEDPGSRVRCAGDCGTAGAGKGRASLIESRRTVHRAHSRPIAAAGLVLFVSAASAGCATTATPVPKVHSTQAEAEAATRACDWRAAADRWHSIFLGDPSCPPRACAETARALLHLKDPESAANLLDVALAKHPGDAELLELKGESLVQLGFRRAAEECFVKSVAADPGRASAMIALGRLRTDLGLESTAIGPLQDAIAITGGDFETWRLLAKACRASGKPEKAYAAWIAAFARGAGSVDDLVEAATLYSDESLRHAHPEASANMLDWLTRAVERDPQCARAYFQLGVLAEMTGKREDAIAHYRRAVEIDPACLMSLTNLAILYSAAGDERNTREMVERALALEQDGMRRKALQKLLDPFEKRAEHSRANADRPPPR